MRRIGKYYYADSGKKIVMTMAGMESNAVKKAFLALDRPEDGLGKVPAEWMEHGWVIEGVK